MIVEFRALERPENHVRFSEIFSSIAYMTLLFLLSLFVGLLGGFMYLGGLVAAEDKMNYLLKYPFFVRDEDIEENLKNLTKTMRRTIRITAALLILQYLVAYFSV